MKGKLAFSLVLFLCYSASSVAQTVLWDLGRSQAGFGSRSVGSSPLQIELDSSAIENIMVGEAISFPLQSGVVKTGVVRSVKPLVSGAGTRIIGSIDSENGSAFSLDIVGDQISGMVLQPAGEVGYRISHSAAGNFLEEHVSDHLVCDSLPPLPPGEILDVLQAESQSQVQANSESVTSTPIYTSNPGASHVLYLDFDGETVSDSIWNSMYTDGEPIVAQPYSSDGDPSSFSSAEIGYIRRVWRGVRDAYAIYDVNVTTDRAVFDSAPVSQKQMAIITPTDDFLPGFQGGRAILNSFGVENRPVFGFLNGLLTQSKWMSMALSHELGHSFYLFHDGLDGQEYHPGQGSTIDEGYGWGPIMGAAYNAFYLTWSNGDYAGSTNTEDDLAKIAEKIPFKNDQVGNINSSATALAASQLRRTVGYGDTDVFRVYATKGQRIMATVTVEGLYPTLNTQLLLYTAAGSLVSQNSPPPSNPDRLSTLNSQISHRAKQTGEYYLHVKGAGFDGGLDYNYSDYGAVGNYQIVASIVAAIEGEPIIVPMLELLLLDDED